LGLAGVICSGGMAKEARNGEVRMANTLLICIYGESTVVGVECHLFVANTSKRVFILNEIMLA